MSGAPNYVENAIWRLLSLQCPAMWLGWPIGAGQVFWVDGINGNDANIGTRPDQPFLTITFALTQCVADRNDYIMVLEHWQETVAINVTRVHIIGLHNYMRLNDNHQFVQMNAAADTAIFTVTALSNHCEIAGFSFGGGATHAAIENVGGTPMGLHIHDCVFGHSFAGDTPQDGIRIGLNATGIRIENCTFYGNGGLAGGTLTRDGIRWAGAGDPLNGAIIGCRFQGCPGAGINFVSVAVNTGGIAIQNNVFALDADTQGAAITLAAVCGGFLVEGNKALFGDLTGAMANNPYLDQAPANNNHWMANYKGNVLIDPA